MGLYYEIAHYAKCSVPEKSAVLIIGKDCDSLKNKLAGYNVTCCDDKVADLLRSPAEKFDAVIVLYKFSQCHEYAEANIFLSQLISCVKTGGIALICEYLGESTLNLSEFTNKFESHRNEGPKVCYGFSLIWQQSLRDTIHTKNDWNDHCWLLKKFECPAEKNHENVRDFLDKNQYTEFGIRSYEWIFGPGFISPGGAAQNAQFLAQLDLKPGDAVLDIGCGVGGSAFQTVREYGANVIGVDFSSNMVTIASQRACLKRDTRVRFMMADITKFEFPANTFDVIYSRDALIHISDKKHLFTKCFKWLKPGGRMLITDYMTGEDTQKLTEEFKKYVKNRNYSLLPISAYATAVKEAGFHQVEGVDLTAQFKNTIETEMSRAIRNKVEFLQMFSGEKFEHLLDGWKNKIRYIDSGSHKWGMLKAFKN